MDQDWIEDYIRELTAKLNEAISEQQSPKTVSVELIPTLDIILKVDGKKVYKTTVDKDTSLTTRTVPKMAVKVAQYTLKHAGKRPPLASRIKYQTYRAGLSPVPWTWTWDNIAPEIWNSSPSKLEVLADQKKSARLVQLKSHNDGWAKPTSFTVPPQPVFDPFTGEMLTDPIKIALMETEEEFPDKELV